MRKVLPHRYGDERIVKKFLWLPKTIGNERRWLEFSKIKQMFEFYMQFGFCTCKEWTDLYWVDDE